VGTRQLIVNADDFGETAGINRGIVQCHREGVVTSTSLMVTGRAVAEAVELSQENPRLSVGLHFDVWGEDEREFDTHDLVATRDELRRQLDRFQQLLGRMPTHIDSHRHAHLEPHLLRISWTGPARPACHSRRRTVTSSAGSTRNGNGRSRGSST
jgi:predicted glycoside hydrolase/deacetylase ChbG (UPF0249 family)